MAARASVQLTEDDLRLLSDPAEVMSRFEIESKEAGKGQFNNPNPCQQMLLHDWWDFDTGTMRDTGRKTDILKARQQGVGLMTQSFIAAVALGTPMPFNVMTVAHADATMERHITRYREIVGSLPALLRPSVAKERENMWWWGNGTKFHGATAGGKTGKAQGFTFQMLHGTECGMYGAAAELTVQSLMATQHETSPFFFQVFESTSEGPGGWWETHIDRSVRSNGDRNFRFFPWTIEPSYHVPFKSEEERAAFVKSLTEQDHAVVQTHMDYVNALGDRDKRILKAAGMLAVTVEQLHWRRRKLATTSVEKFGYDFPLTRDEAFLYAGVSWFPKPILEEMRRRALLPYRDLMLANAAVFEPPKGSKQYAVGVDIGQGTEGDYSAICVVDHMLNQVLVWSDNTSPPEVVGELAVRIAATYGNALLLIESNRGTEALKAARRLGYRRLYMERGKDFTTWGNQTTVSTGQGGKHGLFGHVRTQINAKRCRLNDRVTIDEMITIREDVAGRLGAPKRKHDDRAMAFILAVWAARGLKDPEILRADDLAKRYGLTEQGERRSVPFG